MLTGTVGVCFFKGWDVACKYLSYVVQERHEEDAREVGFGELVVQKIRHQRHAPTVLGDTLLSSGFHPSVARTLLEACDDVQDGQIIVWRHSCSFTVSLNDYNILVNLGGDDIVMKVFRNRLVNEPYI